MKHSIFQLSIVAACGLAGCNAPAVERTAEISRFQGELNRRADLLDIQPGAVLKMGQCEEIAQRNNLGLAVQRLALRLQDDQVRLALATGMPRASASYSYSRRDNSNAVALGGDAVSMENQSINSSSIQAAMPVLDFGITYYAWQMARDQRVQQRLLLERAGQELRRDVRIAYARHAGALRQVRLCEINVKAAEAVLKVGQTMEREALATRAETAVLQAAMAQTRVDLAVAQRKVEETRLDLMRLMSLPPHRVVVIDPKLPELPAPPTAEAVAGLEEHALLVRPEMRVQDLERHISANNVRKQVAGFFPQVGVGGAYNWSSNSFAVNPGFFLYGIQVTDSLLNGGSQLWQYGLAEKTRTVEEEQTLLLSLGVLYDVNLRVLQLQRDRETIHALEVTEEARSKALQEILSLYKEGLATEAGTAKALGELNIQSLGVDKAQTDYLVTWYEFEAATLVEVPAPTTQPAASQPAEKASKP